MYVVLAGGDVFLVKCEQERIESTASSEVDLNGKLLTG